MDLAVTLNEEAVIKYQKELPRFLYCATIAAGAVMCSDVITSAPIKRTFAVTAGVAMMMLLSYCGTMHPALARYAEWCMAGGITLLVVSCATVGFWLPAVCVGIIFANWLSSVPGLTFCVLHVIAFTVATQEVHSMLVMMGISFVLNKLAIEELSAAITEAEASSTEGEDALANIREINKVVLETLRPSRGQSANTVAAMEELMQRLEFLEESEGKTADLVSIAAEIKPCKVLLREFLRGRDRTPDSTPPTSGLPTKGAQAAKGSQSEGGGKKKKSKQANH